MHNTIEAPYRDSPASSRSSSPVSNDRPSIAKPLPSIPNDDPPTFEETYRDEPSRSTPSPTIVAPRPHRYRAGSEVLNHNVQLHYPPYTDAVPENESDDDVPLAYLYPYPTEAPPAYHVAVRQSYRDTLISHIPVNFTGAPDPDEEAGTDGEHADDIRFSVEKVVAGLIISMILLLFSVLMVWNVLSNYSFDV